MRSHKKAGIGKVTAGLLVGSVVGATVGWLTAPASVGEIRRRLRNNLMGAEEKAKPQEEIWKANSVICQMSQAIRWRKPRCTPVFKTDCNWKKFKP